VTDYGVRLTVRVGTLACWPAPLSGYFYYIQSHPSGRPFSPSFPRVLCPALGEHHSRLRDFVFRSVHGSRAVGHWGVVRTAERLRRRYWWSGWTQEVAMFVRSCLLCSLKKMGKPKRQGRTQVYHPSRRFEFVAIDILEISPQSRNGNRKVIVMGDMFTRFMMAVPVCDETAATVASTLLDRWILLFGPPEKLLSDRGKVFLGDVIRRICGKVGTKKNFTTGYHPQTDGCIERFNRTLCTDLKSSSWTRPIGITTWQ
jgi:transposase InsO family protein